MAGSLAQILIQNEWVQSGPLAYFKFNEWYDNIGAKRPINCLLLVHLTIHNSHTCCSKLHVGVDSTASNGERYIYWPFPFILSHPILHFIPVSRTHTTLVGTFPLHKDVVP